MSMERMNFLINKVRENTNLTDKNGMSDSQVLRHFNDGQKTILSIIKQAKLEPDIFIDTVNLTPAEVTADLPSDCFGDNSILYVTPYGRTRPMEKIQSFERGTKEGYFLENNTIGFTSGYLNEHDTFAVKYFRRLPVLDVRRGKISVRSSTSVTLTGQSTTLDISGLSDWFSVVDSNGIIIQEALPITAYVANTGVITTAGLDTGLVTTDHYVVVGKWATSHCELPEECEPFLLHYVQTMMRSKNASTETANQAVFSKEQKELLIGLFQGNTAEMLYPPMTDTEFGF